MKKISTLFMKDPADLGRVINVINPANNWAFGASSVATRKYDGTAVAIMQGELFKRYDVKWGRNVPEGAIACQEPDVLSGHHPHWVKCIRGKAEDRYFFEGFDALETKVDGTYELCGPKINNNREKLDTHCLIKHGSEILDLPSMDFEDLKEWLSDPENDIEGIVFHHRLDGRMCKLRKSDFGIKRKQVNHQMAEVH